MNYTPHCRYCGSQDVRLEAIARWSEELNQWILHLTLEEYGFCSNCGEEMKFFDWRVLSHPNDNPKTSVDEALGDGRNQAND